MLDLIDDFATLVGDRGCWNPSSVFAALLPRPFPNRILLVKAQATVTLGESSN